MRGNRAGKYRNRLAVFNPASPETLDSVGQPITAPVLVGTYFCCVEPLRGNELVSAKQVKAQAVMKISLRWQGTTIKISPLSTFTLNGRSIGIIDAKNIEERNRRYELIGYEIQQGGSV